MSEFEEDATPVIPASESGLTKLKLDGKKAKRAFIISHNGFYADIKKGDKLKDIPDIYFQNLKTEKVI